MSTKTRNKLRLFNVSKHVDFLSLYSIFMFVIFSFRLGKFSIPNTSIQRDRKLKKSSLICESTVLLMAQLRVTRGPTRTVQLLISRVKNAAITTYFYGHESMKPNGLRSNTIHRFSLFYFIFLLIHFISTALKWKIII